METLPCKVLFGETRGDEVIELVERVTGGPCPCRQGLPCPLLPNDPAGPSVLLQIVPTPRHSEA